MTKILKPMEFIPPQDLDAERAVVGTMILRGTMVAGLTAELFYKKGHGTIFSAILNLLSDESVGKVDIVILSNYLKDHNQLEEIGGAAYLAMLTSDAPLNLGNIVKYVEIIKRKAALRRIINASQETAQLSYEEQYDVKNILAQNQRQMNEASAILGTLDNEEMDTNFEDLMNSLSARDTHLRCVNEATGGLHDGDVIVIGGRTSMGKTSLVLGCMRQTAIVDDRPVLYFGPEVTKEKIYSRMLSAMCEVKLTALRRGNVTSAERKKLQKSHSMINGDNIRLVATHGKLCAMDVASKARAFANNRKEGEAGLGLIIIENLQQLTWPEKLSSRKKEIDAIYGCLKALAMELHVPIVISSQVTREVENREDKRPRPSDLKESGEIEDLADAVLLLYREGYYYSEKALIDSDGWMEGEIAVYKGGPPNILRPKFNPEFVSWKD